MLIHNKLLQGIKERIEQGYKKGLWNYKLKQGGQWDDIVQDGLAMYWKTNKKRGGSGQEIGKNSCVKKEGFVHQPT